MKTIKILLVMLVIIIQQSYGQQVLTDKQEITRVLKEYSRCVIERDSTAFYQLFNDGPVTWCGAFTDRSMGQKVEQAKNKRTVSNYFSGSYKSFMRSISALKTAEDKFDNAIITEDGIVASVTMNYSFWPDGEMSNWGNKYLGMIKRDGKWVITSVIYSLDLTPYYKQPSLIQRQKLYKPYAVK